MKTTQFDGGAVPNPGTWAIGVILLGDNVVIKGIDRKLGGIGSQK